MAWLARYDEELDCIFVRWRGPFSRGDLISYFSAVRRMKAYRRGAKLFHDLRQFDFDTTAADLREAGRQAPPGPKDGPRQKLALLVSSDLAFGLVRIFATFRQRPGVEPDVFHDLAQARDWLGLPPDIGDPFAAMTWDEPPDRGQA